MIVIQARTGSQRFPRKILASLHGRTILEHVVERARQIRGIQGIVVATTDRAADDPVVVLCQSLGVHVFRGSESDVLDRYYQCATVFRADPIVRITADCPLLDPDISSGIVEAYALGGYRYVSNVGDGTDGWDTEIMSYEALEWTWKRAHAPQDREHVTTYMRRNLPPGAILSKIVRRIPNGEKWSVDVPADLDRVAAILDAATVG